MSTNWTQRRSYPVVAKKNSGLLIFNLETLLPPIRTRQRPPIYTNFFCGFMWLISLAMVSPIIAYTKTQARIQNDFAFWSGSIRKYRINVFKKP